jgi:hypothetical protein
MDLFAFAEAERDAGMKQAVDHANETHPHWSDRAYDFLKRYAKENAEFISEDVSDAAIAAGEPQPPTLRAWGQIYRRAVKDDVIIQVGAGRSRRRHASICPRWGSCVYRRESAV